MKLVSLKKLFGVVMCSVSLLVLSSVAFGQSFEVPLGEPPRGLKLQGETKGTKVNCTLAIEFTDVVADSSGAITAGGARVIVRCRQGSQLQTFFTVLGSPLDLASPDATQAAILTAIGTQIVSVFGSPGQSVVLKDAEEFAFVDGLGVSPGGGNSKAIMIDLVLALN